MMLTVYWPSDIERIVGRPTFHRVLVGGRMSLMGDGDYMSCLPSVRPPSRSLGGN